MTSQSIEIRTKYKLLTIVAKRSTLRFGYVFTVMFFLNYIVKKINIDFIFTLNTVPF